MKGVIFDLDGTLVDSAPDLCGALNRLLGREGRPQLHLSAVRGMIGDGVQKLVERGFAETGTPLDEAAVPAMVEGFMAFYEDMLTDSTVPYPGVVAALEHLRSSRHYVLGLCTNKPQSASVRILADLHLAHYFSAVLGGDACSVRKPDPGHVLATVEALGVPEDRVVVVGDSPNDAYAARDAGLKSVLVSFGYTAIPARRLPADAVIDHFEDLPAVIERLVGA